MTHTESLLAETLPELDVSTDPSRLDISMIHEFLANESSWARNISREIVERSLKHSLCFGAYARSGKQVGFCRVISDFATFANLVDVFVLPEHRGKGYSKTLMKSVMTHPQLQGLRRFTLATKDAHGLYHQFGFTPLNQPQTFMEVLNTGVYHKSQT